MGLLGYPNYRVVKYLGSGSYGSVDQIVDNIDNKRYALKKIRKADVKAEAFKNEVNLLSMLNSDKIVKFYGSFSDKDFFYIKMEYCNCGKLADFIENNKGKENINEDILLKIIYNICLGLNEIHSKNIIHRDLNPNNIFMNEEYDIKIGDFGISKLCKTAHTYVGTLNYQAPELLKGGEYDNKVDIWALGCIIYELFTLKKCFDCEYPFGLMNNILKNYHGKIDQKYNIKWQELIDSLLVKNYEERPNIDKICVILKNMKRMQIFVKILATQKTIALDVSSLDTIKNIKEMIENKEGIPSEIQILIFCGKNLQDTKTLEYYEICNENTLFLSFRRIELGDNLTPSDQNIKFPIFIIYLKEKLIKIEVEYFYTIEKIKEKIKKKIEDNGGIFPNEYKLIFNHKKLEDNKTLKDYNINKYSIIYLMELDIVQIFVENSNGKKITFKVESSDTFEKIKEIIKEKEGILPNQYKLFINKIELEDNKTFADYNVDKYYIIHLKEKCMIQIFVENLNGKKITFEVEYFDTFKKIKEKIKEKEGILPNQYELIFNGKELDNYTTLKDYNINKDSIIYLHKYFEIYIIMNEKKISLNIIASNTIENIKQKISSQIWNSPLEYKLIFDGIKLKDYKTIEDYKIKEKSNIFLQGYESFEIFISFREKKKIISLNVEESDKIIDVKEKIRIKEGSFPYEFKLLYNNRILEEKNNIDDYNIKKGSTLYLIHCSFKQIFVKTLTGSTIVLNVQGSDTIFYIKKQIENKLGIFASQQRLVYNGKTLEDSNTLDYYNVTKEYTPILSIRLLLRLRGGNEIE